MDKISKVDNSKNSYKYDGISSSEQDIKLEDISILYTTSKKEEKRTSFEKTYKESSLKKASQGEKFLNGLIANKATLSEDLNLSSEEYDGLACIALALASQETGMGFEFLYNFENKGLGKLIRDEAKKYNIKHNNDMSASSGLTQMKIYDFLNGTSLTQEEKDIIKSYGITAESVVDNNLYKNPDKAAVATMVVLSSILNNYDNYKGVLDTEHTKQSSNLSVFMSSEDALKKGNEILSEILTIYKSSDDSKRIEMRNVLKQVFLSVDDSKIADVESQEKPNYNFNEEYQIEKFNKLIGSDFQLSTGDINYIRFALTADDQEMTKTEYCAYGWNKGTGDSGMKVDRLLADKIGIILSNPEDFDYDQFTVNVSTLSSMYAEQSVDADGAETINKILEDA